jgi:HSP20 family protein
MSLIKSNRSRTPRLGNAFKNDPFFSDFFDRKGMLMNLLGTNGDYDFNPAMNVREKEKEFEIELAAPGLQKEDFNISLDEGVLTISAQKEESKEEEKEGYVNKEFSYNSFTRSIGIPDNVDEQKDVSAKYENGVLKLKLHKKEQTKPKKAKQISVT